MDDWTQIEVVRIEGSRLAIEQDLWDHYDSPGPTTELKKDYEPMSLQSATCFEMREHYQSQGNNRTRQAEWLIGQYQNVKDTTVVISRKMQEFCFVAAFPLAAHWGARTIWKLVTDPDVSEGREGVSGSGEAGDKAAWDKAAGDKAAGDKAAKDMEEKDMVEEVTAPVKVIKLFWMGCKCGWLQKNYFQEWIQISDSWKYMWVKRLASLMIRQQTMLMDIVKDQKVQVFRQDVLRH